MFWRKLDEILLELKSQRSTRATLERQIRRLEALNKDLMNRLMARDFISYVQGDMTLSPPPFAQEERILPDEDFSGTIVEEGG